MRITMLGTGAPMSPRAATGLVVTAEGCEPLLIDTCGGFELPRQLGRYGIPIRSLRAVIATHRHLDHIGGMGSLFIADQPLDIYALDDTHDGIRGLMEATFPEWPIHPEVRHITVRPGERFEVGGFIVSFFEMVHRVPTVAVRVEAGGRALAFSADSVPCDALIDCARDADLFLCDALSAPGSDQASIDRTTQRMHPTAREAGEMATAATARALLLTHFASWADMDAMRGEARATYDGPVTLAEDGGVYEV